MKSDEIELQASIEKRKPEPDRYTAEELIAASEAAFGVKSEVVYAALKMAGLIEATRDEAVNAIDKFMKKEVK